MHFLFFLVFLKKDNKFILKNFWPHRSRAKGFSIRNLAREYRLKISSSYPSEDLNQLSDNKTKKSIKNHTNNISSVNLSFQRKHWANRNFSEYEEAA